MSLTKPQHEVVFNATGHFLVRACPGSGKTYTLAYKTLEDIDKWSDKRLGLAVLSFTNSAKDELLKQINIIKPGVRVHYPHFIGTIDSFINSYIFFPYAYLLGYDAKNIEMIGEPFGKFFSHSEAELNSLSLKYDLNGNLTPLSRSRGMSSNFLEIVKKSKDSLVRRGKFTQADSNYYSLQVLKSHPEIAESLARRFPFIYLDEAQDTTAVHWAIIKSIADSAYNQRFGVIGDPDQSIYAWNGALPDLFIEHETKVAQNNSVFMLNDSRRCSQVLCNFYFPLSTLKSTPTAINPNVAEIQDRPAALYYSALPEIVGHIEQFNKTNIDTETLVLCRSGSFAKQVVASLSGNPDTLGVNPWSGEKAEPQLLLQAKYELENGDYRSAVKRAERLIFILNNRFDLDGYLQELNLSKREWYREIETQLDKLPSVSSKSLQEWVIEAQEVVKGLSFFRNIEFKVKNRGNLDYKGTNVQDYFSRHDLDGENKMIETIHSAKGKTTEHTLLILSKEHARRLIKGLSGSSNSTEEMRILYVGITRSSKSLTLCAPIEFKAKLDSLLS